jgi:hypothetical protein
MSVGCNLELSLWSAGPSAAGSAPTSIHIGEELTVSLIASPVDARPVARKASVAIPRLLVISQGIARGDRQDDGFVIIVFSPVLVMPALVSSCPRLARTSTTLLASGKKRGYPAFAGHDDVCFRWG